MKFKQWQQFKDEELEYKQTVASLIVDHFGGTIGGRRFARRIVTLELTSFARSGSAVNETPRTERRARENGAKPKRETKDR